MFLQGDFKMTKKNYELKNHGEIGVVIKIQHGKSSYYPYNEICSYLEVDADLNHETMKINSFRNVESWTYRIMRDKNDSLANWHGRENASRIMGEIAILAAEKQVRRNLTALRKQLRDARSNPLWLMLKPIADKKIKHYKVDFDYHDCKILYENKPNKFMWFVRETGTWLLTDKRDGNRTLLNHVTNPRNGEHDTYYWNGRTLKQIKTEDAQHTFSLLPKQELEPELV